METEILLRLPEVKRRCALARSTLYLLIQRGQFPAPVRISTRGVAWPSAEIDLWVQARIAAGRSIGPGFLRAPEADAQ